MRPGRSPPRSRGDRARGASAIAGAAKPAAAGGSSRCTSAFSACVSSAHDRGARARRAEPRLLLGAARRGGERGAASGLHERIVRERRRIAQSTRRAGAAAADAVAAKVRGRDRARRRRRQLAPAARRPAARATAARAARGLALVARVVLLGVARAGRGRAVDVAVGRRREEVRVVRVELREPRDRVAAPARDVGRERVRAHQVAGRRARRALRAAARRPRRRGRRGRGRGRGGAFVAPREPTEREKAGLSSTGISRTPPLPPPPPPPATRARAFARPAAGGARRAPRRAALVAAAKQNPLRVVRVVTVAVIVVVVVVVVVVLHDDLAAADHARHAAHAAAELAQRGGDRGVGRLVGDRAAQHAGGAPRPCSSSSPGPTSVDAASPPSAEASPSSSSSGPRAARSSAARARAAGRLLAAVRVIARRACPRVILLNWSE